MKNLRSPHEDRLRPLIDRGFFDFKAIVVLLLVVIAVGVAYLALREQPGALVLREADRRFSEKQDTSPEKSREVAAGTDVTILYQSLRLYKLDHGRYPTNSEGLAALSAQSKPYLDKLPVDPWGRPYIYENPGAHAEVEVFTAGPDGVIRTSDDIGSWQH